MSESDTTPSALGAGLALVFLHGDNIPVAHLDSASPASLAACARLFVELADVAFAYRQRVRVSQAGEETRYCGVGHVARLPITCPGQAKRSFR